MIDRVEERFDLKPARLVGDTAYGTAPMLGWMVEDKHIAPHVPVWDKTERKDDTLSSSAFEWNAQANEYTCPQGHALRSDRRQFKIRERRHQGRHRHLSVEPERLQDLLDEGQVLPQHADAQGRAQHLRELTRRRPLDRDHSAVRAIQA